MRKTTKLSTIPELDFIIRANICTSFITTLKNGALVIFRKPISNHPSDNFLERVLCWYHDKFVVWYVNHQTGGACEGTYFSVLDDAGTLRAVFKAAVNHYDKCGSPSKLEPHVRERLNILEEKEHPTYDTLPMAP